MTTARLEMDGNRPSLLEVVLFAAAAVLVTVTLAALAGVSPAVGDLADNDGYMRFLRIRDLAAGGEWFNPVVERSNYPFGESLHWTRPFDVYVLGLATLLRPLLGAESLYWGAFVNGPLLLVALGPLTYWAVGWLLRPGIRSVLMPSLLGLPVVVAYLGLGRVDHHGPILLIFMWTLGLTLRACLEPARANPIVMGSALALGIWVSVEFLVPWAMVAATLATVALAGGRRDLARFATMSFAATAIMTLMAVLLERGSLVAGFDRISIVHVAVAAAIWMALQSLAWVHWSPLPGAARWAIPAVVAAAAGLAVLLAFPGLISGPFVAFDPEVRERWLSHVTELLPVSVSEGLGLIAFRITPIVLGVGAWLVARRREERPGGETLTVLAGWLVVYAALTMAQFRWTLFSHTLALALVLVALGPAYARLGRLSGSTLVRPVTVALILALPLLGARGSGSPGQSAVGGPDCSLTDVLTALREVDRTTVLADLDIGPEILYRTAHNVIATPYGNASGLNFLFDTMGESDLEAVRGGLAERAVGLILLCPTEQDLTYPLDPEGTFYEALVDGPRPGYVQTIPLPPHTDYLLFAVSEKA